MSSTQPVEGGRATCTTTVEAAANLTTEEYVRRVRPWVAVYPCLLVIFRVDPRVLTPLRKFGANKTNFARPVRA